MSFHQFADAISHSRGRNSSMTVQEQYAKYKDEFILRQDKKFFHQYKDEEWLKEKYHPLCVLERVNKSAAGCDARRAAFMESLISAPNAPTFVFDLTNAPATVHDEGKFYDNALFIRNLPSSTTKAALTQVFESSAGFARLILSEPNRTRGFTRYGWAVYASQAECQAALDKLQGKQVDSWTVLSLIANTPPSRPPKYAPAITLTPERIRKDIEAGIDLACKLDHEAGLSNPLQRSVLEVYVGDDSADGELKLLNIVQAYLRNVHFTCYYCALTSVDEEELKAKCPLVHRRASDGSGTGTLPLPSQESWAKELDVKISTRIASPPSVREDKAVREAALKPFYESMTVFEAENKYRCGMCSKLFRGPEFVEKHMKLKHPEECSEEAENRLRKQYFESFRSDPDRPALPPPAAALQSSGHPSQRPIPRGSDRNHYRGGSRYGGYPRRFGDSRNNDFNANVSAPVPEHLKRRAMISYADLDAPAWSPEKPKKLDYGF